MSDRETKAVSLFLAVQDLVEQSAIVEVERIPPSTRKVLGGFTMSRTHEKY
jgi:hypothetical protein